MSTQAHKDDGFHEGSLHVNRAGEYAVISRQNGHFTGLRFGDCEEFTALVSDARRIEQFILAESLARGKRGYVRRRKAGGLELVSSRDYWTEGEEAAMVEVVDEIRGDDEFKGNRYEEALKRLGGDRSPEAIRMRYELIKALESGEYAAAHSGRFGGSR